MLSLEEEELGLLAVPFFRSFIAMETSTSLHSVLSFVDLVRSSGRKEGRQEGRQEGREEAEGSIFRSFFDPFRQQAEQHLSPRLRPLHCSLHFTTICVSMIESASLVCPFCPSPPSFLFPSVLASVSPGPAGIRNF